MASFGTIIFGLPGLISLGTSTISLAAKVIPEAEADAKAIWADLSDDIAKLHADFAAMSSHAGVVAKIEGFGPIVQDVIALIEKLGTAIETVEADSTSLWHEVIPVATQFKAELESLADTAPKAA